MKYRQDDETLTIRAEFRQIMQIWNDGDGTPSRLLEAEMTFMADSASLARRA